MLCTAYQYPDRLGLPPEFLPTTILGLTRNSLDRLFYLVPMLYAGYFLGAATGLITTFIALILMLPKALFLSPNLPDALFESATTTFIGIAANLWLGAWARQKRIAEERQQALSAMATAQEKLRAQIRNVMKYEKALTGLSSLSNLLVQSLESRETGSSMRPAIDTIIELMDVDVILIYSLEEKLGELILIDYEGVSHTSAQAVDRIKLGEGLNGWVARTGEPLFIEDASHDPRLTREVVREENIRSQLIVPVRSRDRVVGTLCVATHELREFPADEIELLTTISNGIGIAIENARLYDEQRTVMDQLRRSEEHYRRLFETAHDAIWEHDLEGNILTANGATEMLTGYSVEELSCMNVKDFLSPEGLRVAREMRQRLIQGQIIPQPYEQRLFRRDGTEATIKLTTNLVWSDGTPKTFQNIARDITEEKRREENLRFYVQQITKAQEDERLRIARELHDSTAQSLIALLHQLENLLHDKLKLSVGEARELWAFHAQIRDILQEVRCLSRDLRPSILDDVGLLPALHWAIRQLKAEYGIEASLQVQGAERRFSLEVELLLFRLVQEALRNIGKHSHASNAEVFIRFEEGKTIVTIKDNGIGFQPPEKISDLSRSGKLGLVGMQERVRLLDGSLEVQSEAGKGTSVIIEAPI